MRRHSWRLLAEWPAATLRVIEWPHGRHAGIVTSNQHDAARLIIDDPALFRAIEALVPAHVHETRRRQTRTIAIGSAIAVTVVAVALWFGWTMVMDLAALAIPRSWQAMVGQSVVAQLAPKGKVCADPAAQRELNQLVARLAGARRGEFNASVVENNAVNAFAAPGGFIVIHSALIDKAESADEVAGVLAHEMSHVIERHSMRLLTRYYGLSLIVMAFTGQSRLVEGLTMFQVFAYSREFEAQADARAIELLRTAGLRADSMAAFFRRLDKGSSDTNLLRYLGTAPADQRASSAGRAGRWPRRCYGPVAGRLEFVARHLRD